MSALGEGSVEWCGSHHIALAATWGVVRPRLRLVCEFPGLARWTVQICRGGKMAHSSLAGTQSGGHHGKPDGGYKTIVYIICAVAALGGLLFGLDQGFIGNSLTTIEQHYNLDTHGGESYNAVLATGGILGALLSGIFARFLGRKRSLLFAGFIFTVASGYSALLPPLGILSACRFALGFGVGVASFIVPLYLAETAPAAIRGSMGTLFQLMITIGIFLISLTNVFIARAFTKPST